MKQIQISAREAKNDLSIKSKRIDKFLEGGHRIEVRMRLRGREKQMKDWAKEKINEFMKLITHPHKTTQEIKFFGGVFSTQIDPIKQQ